MTESSLPRKSTRVANPPGLLGGFGKSAIMTAMMQFLSVFNSTTATAAQSVPGRTRSRSKYRGARQQSRELSRKKYARRKAKLKIVKESRRRNRPHK